VCEQVGLLAAVVDVPGDGASVLDSDLAVAVVSSHHDPGRRRATAAHDAGGWFSETPTRAELLDATGWTPQPDLDSVRVPPSFAHAVLAAHRRHQVSSRRAAELMRGQLDTADFPSALEEDIEP
jgi:hypothetical protein